MSHLQDGEQIPWLGIFIWEVIVISQWQIVCQCPCFFTKLKVEF